MQMVQSFAIVLAKLHLVVQSHEPTAPPQAKLLEPKARCRRRDAQVRCRSEVRFCLE